jgi:hypothetical protein
MHSSGVLKQELLISIQHSIRYFLLFNCQVQAIILHLQRLSSSRKRHNKYRLPCRLRDISWKKHSVIFAD